MIDGNPIVIRDIRNRGSLWRVKYQILDINDSKEDFYEIPDTNSLIKAVSTSTSLYRSYNIILKTRDWRPTVLLPQRLTAVFQGRENELDDLHEWYNDLDSRACLIYGEGGIGKTTLVLEFLNHLLEQPSDAINWFPDVICYYSAKQTKWGPGGLEYIRSIAPVIEDAIRQLVSVLEDRLDQKWYKNESIAIIDKASNMFREAGIQRNDILLVLDNTETLARTSGEEENLNYLLSRISSKLCRLLMTSRRREKVEARPINILPIDENTGIKLLRRLGAVYNSKSILQGSDATLRKVTKQLSGRPLLLDIFSRYSSHANMSIETALRMVLKDQRKDLGEFLFEDAWQRISESHRLVFLLLGQFGVTANSKVIGWTCSELEVVHDIWLETFEETRFGSLVDYGSEYDIYFDPGMREFLVNKFQKLSLEMQKKIENIANKIKKQYKQYITAQDSYVNDRVAKAFSSSAAKAAKLAAKIGEIENAILWYEEAVSIEPFNAALWDRYAWFFMMIVGDLDRAKEKADEACKLEPKEPDFFFTAGMIAARRKKVLDADKLLDTAEALGKQPYLCLIQKAKARIESASSKETKNWRHYLLEAEQFLDKAQKLPMDNRYREKSLYECEKLRSRSIAIRKKEGPQKKCD